METKHLIPVLSNIALVAIFTPVSFSQNRENLYQCGEQIKIDVDNVLENANKADLENSKRVMPKQIGLTIVKAKELSNCLEQLTEQQERVIGFNSVLEGSDSIEKEHGAFQSIVGKNLGYSYDDYSFCRQELGAGFKHPVNIEDVKNFNQCAESNETSVEKIGRYVLLGFMGRSLVYDRGVEALALRP